MCRYFRLTVLSCAVFVGCGVCFGQIISSKYLQPRHLFQQPKQLVVYEPPGRAWLFLHKRKIVAWRDLDEKSVYFGTERSTPLQWFHKLFHRNTHHAAPWQGTRAWVVNVGDGLKAFTIAPDGLRIYVFVDRIEGYHKLHRVWMHPGTFSGASSVAASKQAIYIADKNEDHIRVYTRDGNEKANLPTGTYRPDQLLLEGTYLYCFDYLAKHVSRYSLNSIAASASTLQATSRIDELTIKTLDSPTGFAVLSDNVYILQTDGLLLSVSFGGGGLHYLDLNGLAGDVRQLSQISNGLLFADASSHNFSVLRHIVPATLYTSALDPKHDVTQFYRYLNNADLLPTTSAMFRSRSDLRRQVAASYLDLDSREGGAVFCSLNDLAPDCVSHLSFPEEYDIPSLHIEESPVDARITLSGTGQELGSVLRSASNSAATAATLTDKLVGLNPNYIGKNILAETHGTFTIPVVALRLDAFVSSLRPHVITELETSLSAESLLSVQTRHGPFAKAASATSRARAELRGDSDPHFSGPASQDSGTIVLAPWLSTIDACKPLRTARVAVIDKAFDFQHPMFQQKHFEPHQASADLETSSTEVSGTTLGTPSQPLPMIDPDNDHGTHIAGLIAGSIVDHTRFGVNPEAHLFGVSLGDFISAVRFQKYPIYNLSLGELSGDSPDSKPFDSTGWRAAILDDPAGLFVIAAGNENRQVPQQSLAGLGSEPNVVTVMAANEGGTSFWKADNREGTNYGDKYVGLVAPGENLVSGTLRGGWGRASGTSQATALVSGAASLIKGAYPQFTPWQIKQRLISTSNLDKWNQQLASMSEGGLLDVAAAVSNADKVSVVFQDGTTSCVGTFSEDQMKRKLVVGQREYAFGDIRRIHFDGGSFIMYYSDADPSDNSDNTDQALVKPRIKRVKFNASAILNVPGNHDNGVFSVDYDLNTPESCSREDHRLSNVTDLYNGFYAPF